MERYTCMLNLMKISFISFQYRNELWSKHRLPEADRHKTMHLKSYFYKIFSLVMISLKTISGTLHLSYGIPCIAEYKCIGYMYVGFNLNYF